MKLSLERAMGYNWALRALFLLLVCALLLEPSYLIDHFLAHFTGSIEDRMVVGQWHLVLLNVLLFTAFLVPLSFRKRFDWRSSGLVAAFFISLFVEMYGLSFTVLLASRFFGSGDGPELSSVLEVDLLGVGLSFTFPMFFGTLVMIMGALLIFLAWITLYRGVRKDALVTEGLYSVSRHPQYLGFILMIIGWLVGWPTPMNCIFSSVLIVFYIRVCGKEEREMERLAPGYTAYRNKVPFLM